ncbi:hypothetical protein OIU74_003817 [Salix koriyanagi]|uniref:Uncharacterized protein n=1 Tax=Salix koriyanagi TaxID=2511006 RepID=A0A9Q0V0D6_9ROSI|nr:hypothetical protein OIU74_003817 [Salix koriyanagi]
MSGARVRVPSALGLRAQTQWARASPGRDSRSGARGLRPCGLTVAFGGVGSEFRRFWFGASGGSGLCPDLLGSGAPAASTTVVSRGPLVSWLHGLALCVLGLQGSRPDLRPLAGSASSALGGSESALAVLSVGSEA